ncbi:MAG TPA: SAM-dependent chlorinase/fluorinase [Saprospiraceae bacterium]|nr:SAM-dependent chlorinase/fluorinase [Saprospiraceae bacterium]
MRIVTLTSDFGTRDYYAGYMRGILLSHVPNVILADITHDIDHFDIVQAAFVLKSAYRSYPPGTVHLILVHHRLGSQDVLCVEREGQFFIAPDSGILTLMFEDLETTVRLSNAESRSWQIQMAQAVAGIANAQPISSLGNEVRDFERKIHLKAVITQAYIKGAAIYIDGYENIVFNITKELFEQVQKGRAFELYYKRHDPVTEIHEHYHQVPVGEVTCIFNYAGYLELGINMGKAASLLGFKIDDIIQIHFAD